MSQNERKKLESFPYRDVVNPDVENAVNEWFQSVDGLDREHFIATLSMNSAPVAVTGLAGRYLTHNASILLCRDWDRAREERVPRSATVCGYMGAVVLNRHTHLLPSSNTDFSDQMKRMRDPDEELFLAHYFAQNVWRGIETFPNVYIKLERLHEVMAEKLQPLTDAQRQDLRAGIALYYAQSFASCIEEDTLDFTGMINLNEAKEKGMSLGKTPFVNYFSAKIEQVDDVVIPESQDD